jgi:hypothetical protein
LDNIQVQLVKDVHAMIGADHKRQVRPLRSYRRVLADVTLHLLVYLSTNCYSSIASGVGRPEQHPSSSDYFCGPRCVKFILDYFHPPAADEDLYSLVRDIQGIEARTVNAGTSLKQLELALIERGIFTAAVSISSESMKSINWKYPILVHTESTNPQTTSLGHFIVWLPGNDSNPAQLWNGLNGLHPFDHESLDSVMTQAAILTSPQPIGSEELEELLASPNGDIKPLAAVIAVLSVTFFSISGAVHLSMRRSRLPVVECKDDMR